MAAVIHIAHLHAQGRLKQHRIHIRHCKLSHHTPPAAVSDDPENKLLL
ncbi:hypothetical protein HMPREF1051_1044 [Neisseria sicca VK64]|uniref:Uncharacterized protein n=1 Tax=Neisseria sicca VK64 TaxID=1095748 RepID=I2NV37_NEISI|nr:hypothetical protein HMPREF1051_1044 [Neisseria sicca VK64]